MGREFNLKKSKRIFGNKMLRTGIFRRKERNRCPWDCLAEWWFELAPKSDDPEADREKCFRAALEFGRRDRERLLMLEDKILATDLPAVSPDDAGDDQ